MAKSAGLKTVSITDHDRTDHYGLIKKLADEIGLRAIRGIEISAYDYKAHKKVHIVGMFLKDGVDHIQRLNDITNEKRNAYHVSLLTDLAKKGFDLDYDFVKTFAPNSIIYKSDIYWALKDKYPEKMEGVGFKDIFNEKTTDELARKMGYIQVADAIEAINKDGGLSILAHPQEYDNWDEIGAYADLGLKAIEINHSRMKGGDFKRAEDMADKYDLLRSGGSDFHRLGRFDLGDFGLDEDEFKRLEKGFKNEASNT